MVPVFERAKTVTDKLTIAEQKRVLAQRHSNSTLERLTEVQPAG
jgi:hypothetical protein